MFLPDSKLLLPPKPKLVSRRNFILGAPAIIIARPKIITPAEAALSGWSTSNYIESTTGVITAAPLTMCCWVNTTSLAAAQIPIGVFNSSAATLTSSFRVTVSTSGACTAGTNGATATTGNLITTGSWFHVCGVFSSATSRAAYVNGSNKATNATSATPTGLNRTSVGLARPSAPNNNVSGSIAEVGIWNVDLTDDEVGALGKGFSPHLIRPASLVAYLPLIRDFVDVKGAGFAVTGSLTFADHSPVRN